MGVNLRNWDFAGRMFEFELPKRLEEEADDAVNQAQEVYSDSILDVLEEQPGFWTPKSESWERQSGSSDLFFGKKGQFYVSVTGGKNRRGIRAKRGDKRVFVGARHDVMHHSGYSMETLAEILQSTPDGSRDLFYTAYERVEDEINHIFRQVGLNLK